MNDPFGGHKSNFKQSTRKSEEQIGDPEKTKKNKKIFFYNHKRMLLSDDLKGKKLDDHHRSGVT